MKRLGKWLIFKLGGVLLLLLFIKLLMIGMGIYSARHLRGDATAINYAGSERYRSYKLSFLIGKFLSENGEKRQLLKDQINEEVQRFERILKNLREGEADDRGHRYEEPEIILKLVEINPLFQRILRLPGIYEPELKVQIDLVNNRWFAEVKPLVTEIINARDTSNALQMQSILNEIIPSYVDTVDRFVTLLEDSTNRKVTVFYGMQYLFLMLTIAVTVIAFYLIFVVTKKSVQGLMDGIRAMTAGDFSKRVAILSDDEIGELAEGFNYMAERVDQSYGNLEKKVMEKTTALEEQNRELAILYDTAASLNQSLPLDDILHVFLNKLLGHLNVSSGSIRLVDEDGSLRLVASIGLPEDFKRKNISSANAFVGRLRRTGHRVSGM